jgi:hypothetical protein
VGVSLSLASALLRPGCAALKELDRLPVKLELAIGQNGKVLSCPCPRPPLLRWSLVLHRQRARGAFTLSPVLKIASGPHANAERRVV